MSRTGTRTARTGLTRAWAASSRLPATLRPSLGLEWGKQKVPTLRNVDLRPAKKFVKAYGHNGYFKSLEEIVHFYNTRDVPGAGWPAPEVAVNVNTTEMGNLGIEPWRGTRHRRVPADPLRWLRSQVTATFQRPATSIPPFAGRLQRHESGSRYRRSERMIRSLRLISFATSAYVLLMGALCNSSIRATISAGTGRLSPAA